MRGVGVKLADGVSSEVVLLKMGYIEFARLESSVDACRLVPACRRLVPAAA